MNDTHWLKTEGILKYICRDCVLTIGVSIFFADEDQINKKRYCSDCRKEIFLIGDGHIKYRPYGSTSHSNSGVIQSKDLAPDHQDSPSLEYPYVLTVKHVAEILAIGLETAYLVMERPDFPLIRIGRHKKVLRDLFFLWLQHVHE